MSNKRILLVEDDPNFGIVLKDYLSISNYEVTLAKDGLEGLIEFKNNDYDLCILDVMMPGDINGYQVCEKLKQVQNGRVPYVLLLTARGQKSDVEEGERVGADNYLVKPFSPLELIDNVKKALV